jgi:DNA-binding NtrC family response regulator
VPLVFDRAEVLRLYSRGLEVSGYRVLTADSVEGGMEIIATEHVDAVLVDLRMPYVNGMGMLYRLRKDHPHLPVAIVTGMQNLDKDTLKEIATLEGVDSLQAAVHRPDPAACRRPRYQEILTVNDPELSVSRSSLTPR